MITGRWTRGLLSAVAILVVTVVLAATVGDSRVVLLGNFLAFAALVISLDLMIGQAGLLALGHAAFFGAGAYISTVLNQELGWGLPVSATVAVLVVALVALVVGLPAVSRTAGLYFAMVTFAFGQLLVHLVNSNTAITGGSEGLAVTWGLGSAMPFGFSVYRFFTLVLCFVLFVTVVVNVLVRNSHFGLRLGSVRESSELTSGLGFSPARYRTAIFVLASSLAALVGVIYAPMVGFINPHLMAVEQSIYFLGLLFVGGMNSVFGAFLGVGLLSTLPQYLEIDPVTRPIVVGLAMVAVVLAAPRWGLAGLIRSGVDRVRRRRDAGPPPPGGGSSWRGRAAAEKPSVVLTRDGAS